MNIVTWVIQGLLSVGMLLPGLMKTMMPYEELVSDPNMGWAGDFSPMQIMIIGALEILGVIGLNLPFLLKKYKKVVPIASAGLALTMIGAIVTHVGRGENPGPVFVLLAFAIFVTYARKDLLKS
ncbi:MAG: hypothetical protein COB85_00510 [Bacteroidetes bacterium]|nr:MAG: hypothetical protein COB85_00510 [Bacteroidota bacterium]